MKPSGSRRLALIAVACSILFSGNVFAEVGGTPARKPGEALPPPVRPSTPQPYIPPEPAVSPRAPSPTRPAVNATTAVLQEAIEDQKSRRAWAIGGFVTGGVVVIGGLVYAMVEAQNKANRTGEDQYYVNWIGLGVGIPILAVSVYNFVGAQKQLNRLRRGQVGIVPLPDGAAVSLALDF
jgi:hypothetical protein